jgi:hypothetical protein
MNKLFTALLKMIGFVPESEANTLTEADVNDMAKRYDRIMIVKGIGPVRIKENGQQQEPNRE